MARPARQTPETSGARTLLEETPQTEISDNRTGKTVEGKFVWLRFKTKYAVGEMHEDVYLEREGDAWRAVGIFMSPAN